jgi:hypothetical protein
MLAKLTPDQLDLVTIGCHYDDMGAEDPEAAAWQAACATPEEVETLRSALDAMAEVLY